MVDHAEYREELLDVVSSAIPDEDFAEKDSSVMQMDEMEGGDRVPVDVLDRAIRMGTISLNLCPVMMGSAYRDKRVFNFSSTL